MTLPVDTTLDFQSQNKVTGLPAPSVGSDAVNKTYVDAMAQGVVYLEAVRVASTAALTVAAPGASIDAQALSAGDRVLAKNQAAPAENGLWVWNGAAVPMTRPTDYAHSGVTRPGMTVYVEQGTANAGALFSLVATAEGVVDTTSTTWTQTNGTADITVSAPLSKSGNNIAIDDPLGVTHGGTGAATAAGARTNLSVPGIYATTIGDSSTLTFAVTHNLGTRDVLVSVYDMATGALELAGVTVTGLNTVSVGPFGVAPGTASGTLGSGVGKRVVVMG